MAQNKKVSSPAAAKAAPKASPLLKTKQDAVKHKSTTAGAATAAKTAAKVSTKPSPAAKSPDKTVSAPSAKKVDVKTVPKPTGNSAPSKAAPTKAAPVKSAPSKADAPKVAASAKSVFNKDSVRAATAPAASTAKAMPAAVAKPAAQRITAPVTVPKAVVAAPVAAAAAGAGAKKSVSARHGFKTNEYIVYPAHGVGRIVGIEEQEIAGMALELFVITFDKDKMTLRVPTGKLTSVGMRKLAEEPVVRRSMETLKGRARVKRTMWSRRAQEYEAKINSGDLVAIAEVVRDLYRSETQPEQSYSERQLYEAALDRMAREIAAVEKLDERGAVQRITEILAKSAKGRRLAAEGAEAEAAVAEAEADDAEDADVKAA
jgi:CarD family transcriptional regulator